LDSKSNRTAALDDADPKGKSPGRGAEFVAVKMGFLLELSAVFGLPTVRWCCAHSLREPRGQDSIAGVGFQLFARHALKELVQIDVFGSIDPLACCVDLRISLHCRHDCRRRDIYLPHLFDDSL
jgi:hypothetical protein